MGDRGSDDWSPWDGSVGPPKPVDLGRPKSQQAINGSRGHACIGPVARSLSITMQLTYTHTNANRRSGQSKQTMAHEADDGKGSGHHHHGHVAEEPAAAAAHAQPASEAEEVSYI